MGIGKNEPVAANRRIYVEFLDNDNALLSGQTFASAGETQISQGGAAWTNAAAAAVEVGGGLYYVELSQAETNVDAAFLAVKLSKGGVTNPCAAAMDMTGAIAKNEATAAKRRVFMAFYDDDGALLAGQTFSHAAHEIQVSKAGSAWGDAANDAVAIGLGFYYGQASQAETNFDGATLAFKLTKGSYRPQFGTADMSTTSSAVPTIAAVTPTPGALPGAAGGFAGNFNVAEFVPVVIDVTDVAGLATVYITDGSGQAVYRAGNFQSGYVGASSWSIIANGFRFSILPNSGWPAPADPGATSTVTVKVDALDIAGGLATSTFDYTLPAPAGGYVAPPVVATGAMDLVSHALARVCHMFRSGT